MSTIINEFTASKIRGAKHGKELFDKLVELTERTNTEYHRGVLHGYLLALKVQGVIDGNDAISILESILEQLERQ